MILAFVRVPRKRSSAIDAQAACIKIVVRYCRDPRKVLGHYGQGHGRHKGLLFQTRCWSGLFVRSWEQEQDLCKHIIDLNSGRRLVFDLWF